MGATSWQAVLGGVFVLGLSFLTACGGNEANSAQISSTQGVQGRAGLCTSLQLLGKSLAKLKYLNSVSTLDDANGVRKEVDGVLSELSEAESNVLTRQISQLQASFEGFDAELDSMISRASSGNQPLGAA